MKILPLFQKLNYFLKIILNSKRLIIFFKLISAENKVKTKIILNSKDIKISKQLIAWFKKQKVTENNLKNKNFYIKIIPSKMWLNIVKLKHEKKHRAIDENDYVSLALIFKNILRENSSFGLIDYDIQNLPYTKFYRNIKKRLKVIEGVILFNDFVKNFKSCDQKKYLNLISNDIGNPIKLKFKNYEYNFEITNHLLACLDLNELQKISSLKNKRVADLGSGLGFVLNIIFQLAKTKVYFIDIPENLILAAAISMYFSPNAKKYFYDGNQKINDEYDMYFIPHYAISKIPKNSISLFINIASLPEMNKSSSKYYIEQIDNLLESKGKVFSINRNYDHKHKAFANFKMNNISTIFRDDLFKIVKKLDLQKSYSLSNISNKKMQISLYKKIN